jgi:hypothetical protein
VGELLGGKDLRSEACCFMVLAVVNCLVKFSMHYRILHRSIDRHLCTASISFDLKVMNTAIPP